MGGTASAFGDRPEIDDLNARDLAGSLGRHRSIPATATVGAILVEFEKAADDRIDILPTRLQLEAFISVLAEDLPKLPPDRPELPELLHLPEQARTAHARGEWAPDTFSYPNPSRTMGIPGEVDNFAGVPNEDWLAMNACTVVCAYEERTALVLQNRYDVLAGFGIVVVGNVVPVVGMAVRV